MKEQLIKSCDRVRNHAEVYTAEREVNAMLDLVKAETENIESRFLEPACGTGNFLVAVLERKLNIVCYKYQRQQQDFERYAFVAVASIYGVDILWDNVLDCRARLLDIVTKKYKGLYGKKFNGTFLQSMKRVYKFVPMQDFTKTWTDADLYQKYNLTEEEIEYIKKTIKPMEIDDE